MWVLSQINKTAEQALEIIEGTALAKCIGKLEYYKSISIGTLNADRVDILLDMYKKIHELQQNRNTNGGK